MATIAARLEAFRQVMVDANYRQSGLVEEFDTSMDLHHQFFLQGPEISGDVALVNQAADTPWTMRALIAWQPQQHRSDPDKGRFEIATDLDTLIGLWTGDATVHSDVFTVSSAAPTWIEEKGDVAFWLVTVEAVFGHMRSF